jgi:hypothetical protein
MLSSHILFLKNPKKEKRNMLEWPNHTIGGGRPHISSSFLLFCFVFLKNKIKIKYVMGAFWKGKKKSEWSNCNNLKV